MLQAFCDHAERKGLNARDRFITIAAVAQHAGEGRHFSQLAAVGLAFQLDGECHVRAVPSDGPP